ncbi:hypothetical protein [Actinocatenispora rupis]|uniref:PPE family protein n=1 Tax=Actinocatenispora rupis TaxID=519421 RepID=A0A8J3NC60_9ACTN|nr:hypothetical protein [Actinocatenispora rupis]GID11392.1 hypothetical protein Aru02nite_22810 [Actinocatenispora rupis]
MSDSADSYTWEGIISAVTMAGRPDRIHELQMAWNHYFQILDAGSRTLRDLRAKLTERDWSGSGADAYRQHYTTLVAAIDDFYDHMSKLIDVSGDTADALTLAISQIPLPDMADPDDLGMHTIHASDARRGNQVQYNFFRSHRDRYTDGGFLYHALDKGSNTVFSFTTPKKRAEKAQRWYDEGTRRARAVFSTLLAAYGEQHAAIPAHGGNPDLWQSQEYRQDGAGANGGGTSGSTIGAGGSGFGPGSSSGAGGGSGTAFGRQDGSDAASHEPAAHASSWSAPHGTGLAGSGSVGDVGAPPVAGLGADIGGGGAGGGAGYGSAGYGGIGSGSTGYGAVPGYGAGGVAPRSSEGSGGIGGARGRAGASGSGETYGGIPGSGANRGGKDGDERQTWLHEDRDVWSTPLGPPSVIE